MKILLKSVLLVFIILSIYFIVNPSACSNVLMGRVAHPSADELAQDQAAGPQGELLVPVGDRPLRSENKPAATTNQADNSDVVGITDTNTLTEEQLPRYSQEDVDYAVASRYVELENEYTRQGKTGKDVAKEISATVMEDFEMTEKEWEAFLERATASNLFNKVREDLEKTK